jgi:hypothetical protein
VADLDSDSLFDSFNVETFYGEIKRSPEYMKRARLMGGNFIKLETGITIIRGGKIICGDISHAEWKWAKDRSDRVRPLAPRRPCQPNRAHI